MTIEFRCNGCGQLLKAPDEAASRRAQCPKCDATRDIPSSSEATTPTSVAATPYVPVTLSVKATLSQTATIFKANLVSTVMAIVIAWGISAVLLIGISLGVGALAALFKFPDLPLLLGPPLAVIGLTWVKVGAIRYFITVARGEPAALKLLFSGDRGFAAFFSTSILLAILSLLGLALCIIPGVWIGLMLWPSVFLAVDRDLDLMRAFRAARMLTKGNIVASLILIIIAYAIIVLSPVVFVVGGLFGMAYSVLLFAVMYNTLVTGGRVEG